MTDRRKALEQGARRMNKAARLEMGSPEFAWYLVFALSGREFIAQKAMRHWGAKVYLPLCRKWRRENRYQRDKTRIAYPAIAGSVFAGFPTTDVGWFDIFRNLPSVYGVLGIDGAPVEIPGERVAQFVNDNHRRLDAKDEEKFMRTYNEFGVGDRVCIVEGPFAGHVSKVEKITGAKAHMLIKLLGGIQHVELPVDIVEKAA